MDRAPLSQAGFPSAHPWQQLHARPWWVHLATAQRQEASHRQPRPDSCPAAAVCHSWARHFRMEGCGHLAPVHLTAFCPCACRHSPRALSHSCLGSWAVWGRPPTGGGQLLFLEGHLELAWSQYFDKNSACALLAMTSKAFLASLRFTFNSSSTLDLSTMQHPGRSHP